MRRVRDGWDGERDETGAVLILALVFLLIGVVIAGALTGALTNDLANSNNFASARSLQYAARSATDLAIQRIRYTPLVYNPLTGEAQTLNASPPSYCWGNGPVSELPNDANGKAIDGPTGVTVWCSTAWNPTSAQTRVVTFSTCNANKTAAACALNPLLQAVVTFDDYPLGAVSAPTTGLCIVYCGTSMSMDSWVWSPVVPTVTGLSPTGGSINGLTSVAITGTGFVSGASVTFVEESGGIPASDNVVFSVPAQNVMVNSPTSMTVVSPAVTEGTTYFVTVTTPTGTSADSANDIFTYSQVAPQVSSISPTEGPISGGNSVTITGTGFISGASVHFVEEEGNSPVTGGLTVAAPFVSVTKSTSITAVSPGVTKQDTYFVTVTTPAGTSAYNATNGVFTYEALYPNVFTISPSSGPTAGGTVVTITGTGFISGATVTFVEESGYNPVSNGNNYVTASATVEKITPTSITVASPAVTATNPYFVTVTTSIGTSCTIATGEVMAACAPVYTYSNVGVASKLVFTQSPSNSAVGTAFGTQPVVTVEDAAGNTVTTDSSTITLAITSGTPTSGGPGTLTCTGGLSRAASSGVATFAGCSINTAGSNYELHATDGSLAADSSAFSVGAATGAYSGSSNGNIPSTNTYYRIDTSSTGSITSTANTITPGVAETLTSLAFTLNSASGTVHTATVGLVTGGTWAATALTCQVPAGQTACQIAANVSVSAAQSINIQAKGNGNHTGSWVTEYSQP
jgi:hypothetical protein